MGGRGAFWGGTNVLKRYEFRVVQKIGTIKRIVPIKSGSSIKTPTLSHSPNAIYATVRPDGKPKQITVYGKDRRKLYDIDLDHDHSSGGGYEYHVQYYDKKGKRDHTYSDVNREQKRLIKKFMEGIGKA